MTSARAHLNTTGGHALEHVDTTAASGSPLVGQFLPAAPRKQGLPHPYGRAPLLANSRAKRLAPECSLSVPLAGIRLRTS